MILNRFILSAIALLASHLTVGVIGYLGARNYYLLQIEQIRTDAQIELAKAIADKNEKENVFNKALSESQSSLGISLEEINRHFNSLAGVELSAPDYDSDYRMHNREDAGSDTGLSDTATASGTVPERKCECNGTDRAKLQKLYQRQLVIARDCDITATHYNALIEYYQSISK